MTGISQWEWALDSSRRALRGRSIASVWQGPIPRKRERCAGQAEESQESGILASNPLTSSSTHPGEEVPPPRRGFQQLKASTIDFPREPWALLPNALPAPQQGWRFSPPERIGRVSSTLTTNPLTYNTIEIRRMDGREDAGGRKGRQEQLPGVFETDISCGRDMSVSIRVEGLQTTSRTSSKGELDHSHKRNINIPTTVASNNTGPSSRDEHHRERYRVRQVRPKLERIVPALRRKSRKLPAVESRRAEASCDQ